MRIPRPGIRVGDLLRVTSAKPCPSRSIHGANTPVYSFIRPILLCPAGIFCRRCRFAESRRSQHARFQHTDQRLTVPVDAVKAGPAEISAHIQALEQVCSPVCFRQCGMNAFQISAPRLCGAASPNISTDARAAAQKPRRQPVLVPCLRKISAETNAAHRKCLAFRAERSHFVPPARQPPVRTMFHSQNSALPRRYVSRSRMTAISISVSPASASAGR